MDTKTGAAAKPEHVTMLQLVTAYVKQRYPEGHVLVCDLFGSGVDLFGSGAVRKALAAAAELGIDVPDELILPGYVIIRLDEETCYAVMRRFGKSSADVFMDIWMYEDGELVDETR